MTAASDYLNQLLGVADAPSGQATTTMSSLFGDGGASSYLDRLLGSATPGNSGSTGQATQELTADQRRHGSYGTSRATAGADLTNVDSVAEMAARGGWADPKAFSLDMLTTPDLNTVTHGEGDSRYTNTSVQFKPEIAAARGMGSAVPNKVDLVYGGDQNTYGLAGSPVEGYKVLAGTVQGEKRPTSIYYQYDKDGKFQGANFDVKTKWYEDAAPLISMAGMAFGLGGLGSSIGAGINSSLGLGLGTTGQAALGGAAIGGGTAALTGQNPIKGAAVGAVGAGIGASNPAGMMGVTNPIARGAINGAISGGARSLLTGQDLEQAIVGGTVNGAMGGLTRPTSTRRT